MTLVRMRQSVATGSPPVVLLNETEYDLADSVAQRLISLGWATATVLQVTGDTPVTISGTPTVGNDLSCAAPASATRQWLRNGSNIAGATNATYTLQAADQGQTVTCRVTLQPSGVAVT